MNEYSYTNPMYDANVDRITTILDVCEGTVRAKGERYLPKYDSFQSKQSYENFLSNARFFPATKKTIDAFIGMIFRKTPIVDTVDSLKELLESFYNTKTLEDLARDLCREAITVGNFGCFLDYPVNDTSPRNAFEVVKVSPKVYLFTLQQIINWSYDSFNNLQMVVIKTGEYQLTSRFKHEYVERYIILELREGVYTKTIVGKVGGLESMQEGTPKVNGSTLNYIPFYTLDSLDTSPIASLIEPMVDTNLSLYKMEALKVSALIGIAMPTPYILGRGSNKLLQQDDNGGFYLPRGLSVAYCLEDADTKIGYLSYEGKGLDLVFNDIRALKEELAALGSKALSPDKRQVEATETATIYRIGEFSSLAGVATQVGQFIKTLLDTIAEWHNIVGDNSYNLNTDYIPETLDGSLLQAIIFAWQNNAISQQDMFNWLQQAEFLPRGLSFKEYMSLIENEKIQKQKLLKEQQEIAALAQAEALVEAQAEASPRVEDETTLEDTEKSTSESLRASNSKLQTKEKK